MNYRYWKLNVDKKYERLIKQAALDHCTSYKKIIEEALDAYLETEKKKKVK